MSDSELDFKTVRSRIRNFGMRYENSVQKSLKKCFFSIFVVIRDKEIRINLSRSDQDIFYCRILYHFFELFEASKHLGVDSKEDHLSLTL